MTDATQFIPKLRGLVSAQAEQEITRAFRELYNYFDNQLQQAKKDASAANTQTEQLNSSLFAGPLAAPIIKPGISIAKVSSSGQSIDASQIVSGIIDISHIPNIPTSKVTGTLPLAQLDTKVVKTDDGLTKTIGAFAITGKITIKDNNGHTVDLLYT